jgi:hypothetical protein
MTYDDEAICLCDAYRADLRPGLCPIHSVSTVERTVMPTYTVTAEFQSEGNPPAHVTWTRDGNPFDALTSVSQILNHDLRDSQVMESWSPRTLSITVTINHGDGA